MHTTCLLSTLQSEATGSQKTTPSSSSVIVKSSKPAIPISAETSMTSRAGADAALSPMRRRSTSTRSLRSASHFQSSRSGIKTTLVLVIFSSMCSLSVCMCPSFCVQKFLLPPRRRILTAIIINFALNVTFNRRHNIYDHHLAESYKQRHACGWKSIHQDRELWGCG